MTDIYKQKSGKAKHKPSKFIRMMKGSVKDGDIVSVRGRHGGGTYATPEIIAQYENWIDGVLCKSFRSKFIAESASIDTIEQILNVKLERQYKVSGFYIDGYDKENNIAYEIDEEGHRSTVSYAKDKRREAVVKAAIGCKFIRIKV